MGLIESIINMKISNITGKELLKYGQPFNISVTESQADQIAAYLRSSKANIFNDEDRAKVIREIAKIAGPQTAKKVNQVFLSFLNMK